LSQLLLRQLEFPIILVSETVAAQIGLTTNLSINRVAQTPNLPDGTAPPVTDELGQQLNFSPRVLFPTDLAGESGKPENMTL